MTRALIVEDKEENLCYLETLMTAHGYAVETASHGAEALAKARRNPPELIISDLLMPVMDGYTLLRHCKSDPQLKNIPFIVYTATYTSKEDEQLAVDLGADAFILKPCEPEDFIARLDEIQSRATRRNAGPIAGPGQETSHRDQKLLKSYSETLIHKLEDKTAELEEANRALKRDIARRELAESALRESEQRFRQLAENINEVFWLTNAEKSAMLYVSPAYERIWGRTCESLYRSPTAWTDAIHPDDRDRIAQACQLQRTLHEYEETYRIVRPDGAIRWIRDRAFPVANAQGDIYRIVGIAKDVTNQKAAAERIREQAALLDQTQDAVLVTDLENRVLHWNAAAERIYGWSAAEAIGEDIRDLVYRDPLELKDALDSLMLKGTWTGEVQQTTKAGLGVTIEGRWTLLRDESGAPKSVLAVNTNVTERKEIEAKFLRAQRMESIGTLAGGIAHDLNNLLAPIVMGIDLIRAFVQEKNVTAILDTMENSAMRGTDLVKQVLSFSRGVEGDRVMIPLKSIVGEIQSIVESTFPKNITFRQEIPENLSPILGDPTQINQVLLNLCVNARDAMASGGFLTVRAKNVEIDATIQDCSAGPYVVVEVVDEGCGMTKDLRDRVFEPFFTTKNLGMGTGLGLSTVEGIVRSHGGFMHVSSKVEEGSIFKVYLPVPNGSAVANDPVAARSADSRRGHGELILIVDDEAPILNLCRQLLQKFGYRTLGAADGAEAIRLYTEHRPEIALVLTDIMMPVMDGVALIAALRKIDPTVRIIAASGFSAQDNIDQVKQIGVKHFLSKPFSADRMLALIGTVLAEGTDPHSVNH